MYFLYGDGEGEKKVMAFSWFCFFVLFKAVSVSEKTHSLLLAPADRLRCLLEQEWCSTDGSVCQEKLQRRVLGTHLPFDLLSPELFFPWAVGADRL